MASIPVQVAGWDADFRAASPVLDAVYQLFQQASS